MGAKKKGPLVATSEMTTSAGKDRAQNELSKGRMSDEDLLKQIRLMMQESEQRITRHVSHLETKIDDLQQQILGINRQLGELKQETKQLKKEVEVIDADTNLLKSNQLDLRTGYFRLLYETSLYRLRIQNFPESTEEWTDEKIIRWLAEISQLSEQSIRQAVDMIFRVQSRQVKKAGMGREVMVKFCSRDIRDKIFEQTAYKEHFIEDQRILILKDIPYEIRQRRLPYKELTTLLREHQVKYRWLIPEVLLFVFKENLQVIKSTEDLNRFQKDNVEMFGRITRQDLKKIKAWKKL